MIFCIAFPVPGVLAVEKANHVPECAIQGLKIKVRHHNRNDSLNLLQHTLGVLHIDKAGHLVRFQFHRHFLIHELRGFAPIGVLEYWSDGFKVKKYFSILFPITPVLHHSIWMAKDRISIKEQ